VWLCAVTAWLKVRASVAHSPEFTICTEHRKYGFFANGMHKNSLQNDYSYRSASDVRKSIIIRMLRVMNDIRQHSKIAR
jgi:hypothetical protein